MILLGDAAEILKDFNDSCIDLTVTSPPYDNLRTYGGFTFDFEAIARELYRVTKEGGVVVWIVGDQTIDGSEATTSAEQKIYFRRIGFKIHDTMIWQKSGVRYPSPNRYYQTFDYMFVFCKDHVKTFNPLRDHLNTNRGKGAGGGPRRQITGELSNHKTGYTVPDYSTRRNIWTAKHGDNPTEDQLAYSHPAIMSEDIAQDHIKSWSNEGDLILDPFAGSGTTLKTAHQLNRKWIGIEINPDYVQLAKKRLTPYVQQQRLDQFVNAKRNPNPFQVQALP